MASQEELRKNRLAKLERIRKAGIGPYPDSFERTHSLEDAKKLKIGSKKVQIAGRIMTIREMGQISFAHLQDASGQMQIVIKKEELGEEKYKFLIDVLDSGDFIGAAGEVIKTKAGEISLLVSDCQILSKALLPLPEKWHGLQDTEAKYRQRHLDLIMNRESMDRFLAKSKIVSLIRAFMEKNEFVEVETPALSLKASGALAKPFITHHEALDTDFYLRIAPETYLKRCVVGGLEKVYEFARCFRNEGLDPSHLQDFTMLEFYWAYQNYEKLMDFTEQMFTGILKELFGKAEFTYGEHKIKFKAPLSRISFRDLLLQDSGIDIDLCPTKDVLWKAIKDSGIEIEGGEKLGRGNLIDALYKKVSRPKIIQPVFLVQHPIDVSPLARKNDDNPLVVDRFQLVINGWEIVNAYSELVDPIDQRQRFERQAQARQEGDSDAHMMDEDYLRAMEHGMPPIAGWGMGIERLATLLTNQENLRDVVLFPLMRPEKPADDMPTTISSDKPAGESSKEQITSIGVDKQAAENLIRKHCEQKSMPHLLATAAAMKALAAKLGELEDIWEIAGLVHDIDYDIVPAEQHCGPKTEEILEAAGADKDFIKAIQAHNEATGLPRESKLAKALFACDGLTGFITAVTLVRPSKKLADVEVRSVKKKMKDKAFAAQVNRENIRSCETELNMPLDDFIGTVLDAMKGIADKLGL